MEEASTVLSRKTLVILYTIRLLIENFRWDSSDPDRAPPPLPLNPGSSSPAAKPNASATIAAAAEALTAKARESAYTVNPSPNRSPERSLIKGQYHKRMQSLQNSNNANLRDRSTYLDGSASLERSPERPPRTPAFDYESRSPERSPTKTGTPTPTSKDFTRDTPSLRPTSRPPLKAILGENTPPSATMLALQNTPTPKDIDTSLSNITNGSTAMMRTPQTFDAISTQILSLTTIATNLQREMAQLSRRSKDNATDLISLKEATNLRDEDIRKSLRDLVSNLSSRLIEPGVDNASRVASHYGRGPGSFLIDSKPHVSPSGMPKSYSLPRIPSPSSFSASLEREIAASSYNMDGAASIALLEKVLREMGTKEGQERLFSSLAEIQDRSKLGESDGAVAKKLEEILAFLKEGNSDHALVARKKNNGNVVGDKAPKLELEFDPQNMSLSRVSREATHSDRNTITDGRSSAASGLVNEDMLKMLKKMKDSITEGGGMTAELKALVRELRGEVLGMGREIGRKLDQAESTQDERNTRGDAHGPGREEIAHIVEQGLTELKEQMESLIRERRRQSSSSTVSRTTVDSQEVYTAVKSALSEIPFQQLMTVQHPGSGIEREEILEAVREAWETYKPEIELQNFGLERDEILQCLKEGLQEYQPKHADKELGGVNYEEVLDAVHEGLKNFKPPAPIETEASITKEEILMTVRECLDSFEFPNSSIGAPRELEMTREDVLDAVKEGLSAQAPISKEFEFNRDDLFDAVRAGLDEARTPMDGVGEQVLDKMQDLIDGMRVEFKQYSVANGGDTEQLLDAMKDGLEVLRADIETYVDRAADVTGKDEIIETVRDGLEHLRNDLESSIANAPRDPGQSNNGELLDAMEKEFEHLRQTIVTSMLRSGDQNSDRDEILDALKDGITELKTDLLRSSDLDGNAEAVQGMKEEFEHLRETLTTTLVRSSSSTNKDELLEAIREGLDGIRTEFARGHDRPESILSSTGEILDAFTDGLDGLRADVERMVNKPLDMTVNYEILDTLKEGLANLRADVDRLHSSEREATNGGGEVVIADPEVEREVENLRRNDIENLEIMITQLRIKVESLDNMPPPPPPPPPPQSAPAVPENIVLREDLEGIEISLKDVHVAIAELAQREHLQQDDVVTKDDMEAIETLLRNTKAQIDEMISPDSEGFARVIQLEAVESLMKETRDAVHDFGTDKASKDDLSSLEVLLQEVRIGLDEMREKIATEDSSEKIVKSDLDVLETLCMDTKTRVEELVLPDVETLPGKDDMELLGNLVKSLAEKNEEDAQLTARAFEARKIEHGGIADKIEDVKLFLDDVRAELKAKISEDSLSIQELGKTLETFTETVVGSDAIPLVNELKEAMTRQFESLHGDFAGSELEREQKHNVILGKHDEHKDAIIAELNSKIDTRFDEIIIKYDDAQLAAQEKERAFEEKDIQQTEALNASRTIAEDLRLLVDTLGTTVIESCDRMGEDSRTIFERIESMAVKLNELKAANGEEEHQSTRAEISKTLTSVEGVHAHVTEYQPKILETIKEVLTLVGHHYEQAKTSTEEIKTSVQAIPAAIPLPAITAPPTPPIPQELPVFEKYDDSAVHAKLNQLVDRAEETGKSLSQFRLLDQIRDQVTATANDFNSFIATQQATITQAADDRTKEMEEVAIALQMRISQKEAVESDIVRISNQRQELMNDVEELLHEKEELITQKSKMQADLTSLQTALQIRREELHIMEARADGLERRVLDGVLDHSRSLLATSRPQSSLREMNLKRVVSAASNTSTATSPSIPSAIAPSYTASAVSSGIGMALKRRQPPRAVGSSNTCAKGDRRILSLSTLGANKGVNTERSMVLATPATDSSVKGSVFGISGVKRSHSVKSNFPARKTSWGGTKALGMYADEGIDDGEDKENSILDEEDEDEDGSSEGGTERRTSYSGTYTGTMSYGDGSTVSGDDRRTSYAPSTVGTVGTKEYPMTEDGEDSEGDSYDEDAAEDVEEREEDPEHRQQYTDEAPDVMAAKGEISNAGEMVVFGQPSDSGIGTDMPTAALEAGGSDYFRNK